MSRRKKKKPVEVEKPTHLKKQAIEQESGDSSKKKHISWQFKLCDHETDKWRFKNSFKDNQVEIFQKMIEFEGMTIQEIMQQTHGNSGSSNHFIGLDKLCKDAQKRFKEMNYDQYSDDFFSLRLGGKKRLYGVLIENIFYIIWYDTEHIICPSFKRHT